MPCVPGSIAGRIRDRSVPDRMPARYRRICHIGSAAPGPSCGKSRDPDRGPGMSLTPGKKYLIIVIEPRSMRIATVRSPPSIRWSRGALENKAARSRDPAR